jgi:hypothetical protein
MMKMIIREMKIIRIFSLILLSFAICMLIFTVTLVFVEADHGKTITIWSQKYGNVTPNTFPEPHYTNETDRELNITISVDKIRSDTDLKNIIMEGITYFTIKVNGNKLWFKEYYPISLLQNDERSSLISIPINDSEKKLDSYRVCAHILTYENKNKCDGMNTYKNVTSTTINLSDQLIYVYNDFIYEKLVEDKETQQQEEENGN